MKARQAAPVGTRASGPHDRGMGAKLTVIMLALLWPAQLLTVAGVMTAIAQAQIAQTFHTTQIVWFGLIYTLVSTLLTPFVVKAADILGKKRVMLAITALGLIGDVIAAVAPSYGTMLLGRGIAAFYGPIAALVFATVREVFPPRHVGTASGIIGSAVGVVVTVCPLLAGWIIDGFGFRGALWFLALATAVGLVLIYFLVPETPVRADRSSFDWAGGILLGGSVTALIYGVGQGSVWGWTDLRTLALLIGAVVALVVFVIVERAVAHPLLDVRMLGRRSVATVLAATSIVQGATFAASTLIVLIGLFPSIPGISAGLGWTATHNAVVGIGPGLLLFAIGYFAGKVTRRVDPRFLFMIGAALTVVGMVLQGFFHADELQIILTTAVANVGGGLVFACTPIMIIGAVSPAEQGLVNGMSIMLNGLMTAIGTQVLFAALAQHTNVLDGTAFYADAGYREGYFALAAVVAVGFLVSLAIPRLLKPTESVSGTVKV